MANDKAVSVTWKAVFAAVSGRFTTIDGVRLATARPHNVILDLAKNLIGPFLIHGNRDGLCFRPERARSALSARLLFFSRTAGQICQASEWWHERARHIRRDLATQFPRKGADKRPEDFTWPALAAPFRTSRRWTVTALTDATMLEAEHDALGHCVDCYAYYCVRDDKHVLSIRDPDGRNVSTAEIDESRLSQYYDNCADYSFERSVVQHRGVDNTEPPREAKAALQEWGDALPSGSLAIDFQMLRSARLERQAELAQKGRPGKLSLRRLYGDQIPDYAPEKDEARATAWQAYSPLLPDAVRRAGPERFADICRAVLSDDWNAESWGDLINGLEPPLPAVVPAPVATPQPTCQDEQQSLRRPRRAAVARTRARSSTAATPICYDGSPKNIALVDAALHTMPPLLRQTLEGLGVVVTVLPARVCSGPAAVHFNPLFREDIRRLTDRIRGLSKYAFGLQRRLEEEPTGSVRLEVSPSSCGGRDHGEDLRRLRVHLPLAVADLIYPIVPRALADEAIAILAGDGERLLTTVRIRAARERLLDVLRRRATPGCRTQMRMTEVEFSLIMTHRNSIHTLGELMWRSATADIARITSPQAPDVRAWPEYWAAGIHMALVANGLAAQADVGGSEWRAHAERAAFREFLAAHLSRDAPFPSNDPRRTLSERILRTALEEAVRLVNENKAAFTAFTDAIGKAISAASRDCRSHAGSRAGNHLEVAREFAQHLNGPHPAEAIRRVAAHIVRIGAMGKTIMPAGREEVGAMFRALASHPNLGTLLSETAAWADRLPSASPEQWSAYGSRVVGNAVFICEQFVGALQASRTANGEDRAEALRAVEEEVCRLAEIRGSTTRREPDVYWSALRSGRLSVLQHPGAWPDIAAGRIESIHRLGRTRDAEAFGLAAFGMICGLNHAREIEREITSAISPLKHQIRVL
jgi:hypothetical protein